MMIDHWPLVGLKLTTPDLELRWPTTEELAALADVAAEGIHDPDFMPFLFPWSDTTPQERARSVVLHYWRRSGSWEASDWSVLFVVFKNSQPVGMQVLSGKDFAITREVSTGSWLGQRFHRQGIGTQMRAAVLEFAFNHLGAETACSGAMRGNDASLGVSRKLGYQQDGVAHVAVQGKVRMEQRLRLDRPDWRAPFPVHVEGLDLSLFGL